MGFDFDIVNKHQDINNELKNSGLSYAYLTWKNILNTYSDILYSAHQVHEELYEIGAMNYYIYYDKSNDLICLTKIISDTNSSYIPYMTLQTAEDSLRDDKIQELLKNLINSDILCNEITIRYKYTYCKVSRHFPTYDIEMDVIRFLIKLSSYNFEWTLLFKYCSPWDDEIIGANKIVINTNSYRNNLSENDVNDIVKVYKQCKKYNNDITFLPNMHEIYGSIEICNMPTEAIKNPYFHIMSVIETSVKGYNKNIGKLLPYIQYTEKLICKNILQRNNYISNLEKYVLNTCTYEYAITITAMYIFQACNYDILKYLYTSNSVVLSLEAKYNLSNFKIREDIITYYDCLCYYYASKCNQQNNLPIKYKK